ncbi:hypothetical protein [Corynebacterium epidermidicanis]|uniref:Uncharacterized protein n=1 Tax=Corynebacterium epidermidicanis TaxID=1050174 RepID=A0A0G3GRF7_9CORY|nr:hypothetical protein [Corynebacterium epidermidicanis]AKK03140.1 hypothetical protein CEPID_06400 [Corynebacterium epidermidicanis]
MSSEAIYIGTAILILIVLILGTIWIRKWAKDRKNPGERDL